MAENLTPDLPPDMPSSGRSRENLASPVRAAKTSSKWLILLVIAAILIGGGGYLYKSGKLNLGSLSALTGTGRSGTLTLAVGTFGNNGNAPESVMDVINDLVYSSLNETNKFKLVERSRMKDIEKEFQRFAAEENQNAVTSSTSANVSLTALMQAKGIPPELLQNRQARLDKDDLVKIKTLTKAQYFLVGVVTDFYAEQAVNASDSMGRRVRRSALSITVDARLVNTDTGEIIAAPSVYLEQPKVSGSGSALANRLEKLKIEIARKASREVSRAVVNALYPISVSSVADGKIYLNRGFGMGVKKGDLFTVLALGKAIIDPDTKREIGREETPVGDIQVDQAMEKLAIASVLSGEAGAIKKGMICRSVPKAAPNNETASGSASGADSGKKKVAVLAFRNSANATPKVIDDLQTYFYTELGQYPDVTLIERQQLDKIGSEITLAEDGYLSPASAIKIGEMTGAQYCLIGSLGRIDVVPTTSDVLGQNKKFFDVSVELDCRIIETEKGEVFKTASAGDGAKEEASQDAVQSRALRGAASKACRQLFPGAASQAEGTAIAQPSINSPASNSDPKVSGVPLAIIPFANPPNKELDPSLLNTLDVSLETLISQTKKLPVAERKDPRFLEEVMGGKSKIEGTKFCLATQVMAYAENAGGGNSLLPNVYENGWGVRIEIAAKIIQVENAMIVESFQFTEEVSGSSQDGSRMTKVPDLPGKNSELAQKVAARLTDKLMEVLCPVLVADVSDAEIYLNAGDSTGLKVGNQYTVYDQGAEIKDPQTGRVIGRRQRRAGEIAVTRVERETAMAAPVAPATLALFRTGMLCKVENVRPVSSRPSKRVDSGQPDHGSSQPASDQPAVPKGKVFYLASVVNPQEAPLRVAKAITSTISGAISQSEGASVVTRDEQELAEIGKEFLRGKSNIMNESTRLKTVKLTGARYAVFLGINDWISQVEEKDVAMLNEKIKVQEVNIALEGRVVDLKTGKVLSSGQVTASSPKERLVTDNHGDLNMDVKVANDAANKITEQFRNDGILNTR